MPSNDKVKNYISSGIITLITAGIVALIGNEIIINKWRGRVDVFMETRTTLTQDVHTAITVIADHGTELGLVRTQLENIRGELRANREEMLRIVQSMADDRFRGQDWKREKEILELKFIRIEENLGIVTKTISKIEDKIDKLHEKIGK